jgi:hypothetical protein
MDLAAVCELQARAREAIASAEKYRALASDEDFYHALAVTYERAAREMQLMLEGGRACFGRRGRSGGGLTPEPRARSRVLAPRSDLSGGCTPQTRPRV